MDAVKKILRGAITSHSCQSRIHAEKLSLPRGSKDAQNRILENAAIFLLCVLQRLFGQFPLRNILLDGDIVADGAGSGADWRNRHFLGVETAIFLAVDDFSAPQRSGGDGVPQSRIKPGMLVIRDRKVGILSNRSEEHTS